MSDPSSVSTGSLAPEFNLPAGNGTEIRLADFRNNKNVVLFFIREYY
jgi:peroxiredoxin